VKSWMWIVVILAVAGAGVGGYFLGRSDGVVAGVSLGKRMGAERANRPLVMPLLLATEETPATLTGALDWPADEAGVVAELGAVGADAWTELLNRIPSPLQDHRKLGHTLAWSLASGEECAVCRTQAEYARDLLAAGRTQDEARAKLYQGVRFDFDTAGATTLGPDGAPVRMVWWMDFQCPYCSDTYPLVTDLREKYGDQLQISVLNLPLRIHPEADEAAVAAYAAGKQDGFSSIAEVMFADRKKLKKQVVEDGVSMEKYAEEAGLDLARFRDDYVAAVDGDLLEGQRELARSAGVKSVPTFFVNGVQVRLPRTADAYGAYIDRILAGEDPALDP
jgi:protein-disulfide isomerase